MSREYERVFGDTFSGTPALNQVMAGSALFVAAVIGFLVIFATWLMVTLAYKDTTLSANGNLWKNIGIVISIIVIIVFIIALFAVFWGRKC